MSADQMGFMEFAIAPRAISVSSNTLFSGYLRDVSLMRLMIFSYTRILQILHGR